MNASAAKPAPASAALLLSIWRARQRIERATLSIEEISPAHWRVSAGDRAVDYFPFEDRWRQGSQWGRGTVTLINQLRSSHG